MDKARAAEIWATLEKWLIERCGLPNGRMLDRERPALVRFIGGTRTSEYAAHVPRKTVRKAAQTVRKSAQPEQTVMCAIRPSIAHRTSRVRGTVHADTIYDAKLAAMLERACSLRGYGGDEPVGYGS